ncbi:MAG: hypothetical protein KAQ93_02115, partial [Spirochaetales bacterium]|nr:hypothetical protein [Spirochaetales bacterium]
MDQYYYAVSSLPFLDFDNHPLIKVDEFMSICKSTLIEKDFEIISSVSLTELDKMDTGTAVVKKWLSWEGTLRNEIVKLRAASLNVESGSYLYEIETNSEAPAAARNAYKMNSPLMAEEALDKARWYLLDELEHGHHFDLEKLIVYSLRLQILERKSMFTTE